MVLNKIEMFVYWRDVSNFPVSLIPFHKDTLLKFYEKKTVTMLRLSSEKKSPILVHQPKSPLQSQAEPFFVSRGPCLVPQSTVLLLAN